MIEKITKHKPLLSLLEIKNNLDIHVLKDTYIYCVGKIPSQGIKRLVPCSKPAHLKEVKNFKDIVAVVVPKNLVAQVPRDLGLIQSENPLETVYKIHEYLCGLKNHYWLDFETKIDPTADIHKAAMIADKNVIIGANTIIDAGCVIKERTIIGKNCIIGPSAVIGGDAFEMVIMDGKQRLIKQGGGVYIGNGVVIQSSTNVDRATFSGFTYVDDNVGIDARVHVAHDCFIGKNTKITACAEVSGRVIIGQGAYLGPNCTISNGITLGKNSRVSLGAVVTRNIEDNQTVSGNFAVEHSKWLRFISKLSNNKL